MEDLYKNIKNKINGLFLLSKINPHKDWKNLLYIFSITVLFLILFSLYLLYQIKNQQIFQAVSNQDKPSVLINDTLYKKVDEYFKEKQIKQKEIKDGQKLYKDPSF